MIISSLNHSIYFFYKFIFFTNLFFILISTCYVIFANFSNNVATIKDNNSLNFVKNILIINILSNIFLISLLLYLILFFFKGCFIDLVMYNTSNPINYKNYNFYFYNFDFDIFNIIFFILSLFVAFISLLALDTRVYSSKSILLSFVTF